jgi:translation initiation factor 1 (eIF-1/SUI1)
MKETIHGIPPIIKNDKIVISDPKALRDWADKLGTTTARLKSAVNIVGDSVRKVKAFLNKK